MKKFKPYELLSIRNIYSVLFFILSNALNRGSVIIMSDMIHVIELNDFHCKYHHMIHVI